jgi:hypothetical protein
MDDNSVPVSVCADCLLFLVNNDSSGASPEWEAAFVEGIADWPAEGHFVPGDDQDAHFSHSPCDVCGALAGDRVDMLWLPNL